MNCLLILTSSGRVRVIDEVLPVYQTESLAERGSTAVPQAVRANFFFGKLLRLPGVGPRARTMVTDFAIVSSSATFVAAAAALTFLLFVNLGLTPRQALLAVLGMTFGTPLFAYSAWYFSEPLTVAVLMIAVVALFSRGLENVPVRHAVVAGLALGFLFWIRTANILTVPVVLAALLLAPGEWRRKLPAIAIVGGIVAVAGLGVLARNNMLYGSPFDLGYPPNVEGGREP